MAVDVLVLLAGAPESNDDRVTRLADVQERIRRAERVLRHAVLWRKSSGGTDSEAGSRLTGEILRRRGPETATIRWREGRFSAAIPKYLGDSCGEGEGLIAILAAVDYAKTVPF